MGELLVLYGGTFDPVHDGHLAIARCASEALSAEVHLMPAADPPHRARPGASAGDRVAMLRLALRDEPRLRLDLRELEREEPSWTVDTLRALRRDIGSEQPVALLVGADSFAGLPGWKEWETLFSLAHFVVASREGPALGVARPDALAQVLEGRMATSADALRQAATGRVLFLQQPLHPHAASAIRARIASGQPWRHLLPAAVADYIAARGLYGG